MWSLMLSLGFCIVFLYYTHLMDQTEERESIEISSDSYTDDCPLGSDEVFFFKYRL